MVPFFFMGCWNQDNCGKQDYRKALLGHLIDHMDKAPFDFGIVAGDNAYPHVVDSKKLYYKRTLDTGFSLLRELKEKTRSKRVYLSIGNHDVARPSVLAYQVQKAKEGTVYMPSNVYIQQINPFLRLLVIDTNLLTHKPIKIYEGNNAPEFLRVRTPEQLLKEVRGVLGDPAYTGWTIVVGHEPIVSIKRKGGLLKVTNLEMYEELLEILQACPKLVYLCADVHSFQAWNIGTGRASTPMVVVGTGGGIPDEKLPIDHTRYNLGGSEVELLASEDPYGFCEVNVTRYRFQVVYRPLGCTTQNKVRLEYRGGRLEVVGEERVGADTGTCPVVPGTCMGPEDQVMEGGKKPREYMMYHGRRYRVHRVPEDNRRKYIQTVTGKVFSPFH